jgi:hypothetical protein
MKPGPSATRYLRLIDPDKAWTSALPKGLGPRRAGRHGDGGRRPAVRPDLIVGGAAVTSTPQSATDRLVTKIPAVWVIWWLLTRRGYVTAQPYTRPRSPTSVVDYTT